MTEREEFEDFQRYLPGKHINMGAALMRIEYYVGIGRKGKKTDDHVVSLARDIVKRCEELHSAFTKVRKDKVAAIRDSAALRKENEALKSMVESLERRLADAKKAANG